MLIYQNKGSQVDNVRRVYSDLPHLYILQFSIERESVEHNPFVHFIQATGRGRKEQASQFLV